MRILFITRTHPHPSQGAQGARLHARLKELSELGHEVLVLTRYDDGAVDLELPKRIEIRFPYKSFRAWEWPKSLPMIFAWRPDILHVYDPGLSTAERALSVEFMALTMLESLRKASRGTSSYRGGLVSIAGAKADAELQARSESWKKSGVGLVEGEWLRAQAASGFEQSKTLVLPWDRALGRPLQIALAGTVGEEIPLDFVIDALQTMARRPDFNLTVFLNRSTLSSADRKRLARAERQGIGTAAVGSRLTVVAPDVGYTLDGSEFDSAMVVGLSPAQARLWIERMPLPSVFSEGLKSVVSDLKARNLGMLNLGSLVTEIAPIEPAIRVASDRAALESAWSEIEQHGLSGGRDVAANHISRIYSQIAGNVLGS